MEARDDEQGGGQSVAVLPSRSSGLSSRILARALTGKDVRAYVASVDDLVLPSAVPPVVVLVDGDADVRDLEAACARLRGALPTTKLVLLSSAEEDERRRTAARLHVDGSVSRAAGLDALVSVLLAARRGRLRTGHRDGSSRRDGRSAAISSLTTRETEVLRLVATGAPNSEVAERLAISVHTVRTHVQNVLAKLGAENRLAATAMARRAGILSAGPDATRAFQVPTS